MNNSVRTPEILVVDDDNSFRCLLTEELAQTFPGVNSTGSAARALELCSEADYDVVLLDIRMPERDGMEVLQELKNQAFDGEVIMLTGHATVDTAIASLKMGAYDYLTKPCKLEELESIIHKAYEKRVLRRQNWTLREVLERERGFREFVGESESLRRVFDIVRKVATTDATVLIQGESGVGKELVARAIHRNSQREAQPLVVVDCTSLQPELLQSELFGHEKGSFTGAISLKHGLFEIADTGTIFLDEIAELSPGLQASLLRVMESGTFRRVGGLRDVHVDVRVLTATNRNLELMIREGSFRSDLYYRINVVTVRVPPLRDRREDIPMLVEHFVGKGRPNPGCEAIRPEVLETLYQYSWPGNVRELQNVIERALILSGGKTIEPDHLPGNMKTDNGAPFYQVDNSLPSLKDIEKLYIRNLLKRFDGHRARIASALGISERSLYRKLRDYDLD